MRFLRTASCAIAVLAILLVVASAAHASGQTTTHRVREGDTLWDLARRHGTTPERLAAMNGISTEAILQIGQKLRVPAPRGASSLTASAARLPTGRRAAADGPINAAARARLAAIPSRGAQWNSTLVAISTRLVGVRYRWGGTTPAGFDCSGFLYYVFQRMGIALPRTTYDMFRAGVPVPRGELRVGDLVFFETLRPGPSHAGVYLGDGRFVHSSSGSGRVLVTAMSHRYYAPRYLGARRF